MEHIFNYTIILFCILFKTVRATYDQVSKQMSYEYDADYNETKTTTMGGKTLTSEYDALGRVITKRLNTDNQFTVTYGYRDGANGSSSAMIQSVSNNGRLTSYLYYDDGNIRQIHTPWTAQAFEYDAIGQLIRVDDNDTGHTTVYSYDAGGNMTSEKVYSYTTEAEPATEVLSQRNFTYDTIWKDQMLTCGGKAMTYDGVGNLLSYDGTTFTWTKGRRLSGVTRADGTAAAYTYNHNGQRASKTVGGVKHTYFYSGNLLIREKAGSLDMRFSYDSVGNPVSILYNDVEYYYVKNLQGDAIGLIDTAGTWVVEYSYDVWGNIRNIFGSMASTLGQDNPIRYRGYYYDNETKLYYVISRYYSPELCRFINPDSISLVGVSPMTLTDKNLYAYCDNNPIKLDEAIISSVGGAVSGYIGGAGANEYKALTNSINVAKKTVIEISRRNCTKYASKVIGSTMSWLSNRLSTVAWSSSAKFSVGCGISGGITMMWSRFKSWMIREG